MAWSVTWNSNTLVSSATGVYQYVPGIMQRAWKQEQLPRALGEYAKDLGLKGCDHSLTITYCSMATSTVATTIGTLQLLMSPASGTPGCGTLAVPDYPSAPWCIITGMTVDKQSPSIAVAASGYSGSQSYTLGVTITFRQLRK